VSFLLDFFFGDSGELLFAESVFEGADEAVVPDEAPLESLLAALLYPSLR
jgi:hypothetical protein